MPFYNREQGLYSITDNFFKFWFRFIFLSRSLLEERHIDAVLEQVQQNFSHWLTHVYEDVAAEILQASFRARYPELHLPLAGRWWQGNQEIDLVALNPEQKSILFGEVKWSNKPVGTNIFESLVAKSEAVEWQKKKRRVSFALFSKSGFTPALVKLAQERGAFLFHGEKLLNPTNRNKK